MAKVNNVVRLYDFKTEDDLHEAIDKDLEVSVGEEYGYIYKIQTVQIISPNKALVVFEENTDFLPVSFLYKYIKDEEWEYEEIILDELPSDRLVMSVQELQMLKTLGEVTICDENYAIDNMEYIIEPTGDKYVQIILKYNNESEEK